MASSMNWIVKILMRILVFALLCAAPAILAVVFFIYRHKFSVPICMIFTVLIPMGLGTFLLFSYSQSLYDKLTCAHDDEDLQDLNPRSGHRSPDNNIDSY
jgi:hypothetical protein